MNLRGLAGILLSEEKVDVYVKDIGKYECAQDYEKEFDIFSKYKKLAEALPKFYKNTYMEDIINNKRQIELSNLFKRKRKNIRSF